MATFNHSSYSAFNHNQYISVTMEFRCNLKCIHCMIEDTMDYLTPITHKQFNNILDYNKKNHKWSGIILTGSEITLHKELVSLVKAAKASRFKHVRIQTHGMHLANENFCDTLLDAGVDEFFVSVAGSNAQTHDKITAVDKAYEKMMKGMQYLDNFEHVKLITNTVVTELSYQLLPDIVDELSNLKRLVQMEFWNYWPMEQKDHKNLIANISDVTPYLLNAIRHARQLGRCVEVKNFPECMLQDCRLALHNDQPELIIDPVFWREFEKNGFQQCLHKDSCASSQCLGLNDAYTSKFGWEKNTLKAIKGI